MSLVWFSSKAANIRMISLVVMPPVGVVEESEAVAHVCLDMASSLGGRIISGVGVEGG
jgi:hypothetical protein